MTYITSASREQINSEPATGTVRVHWTFGKIIPDVIQIIEPGSTVEKSILHAEVEINKETKTPTSHDFIVQAPYPSLVLVVAPRTLPLSSLMVDEWGEQHSWENFSFELERLTVAATQSGGGGHKAPIKPAITYIDTEEGVLTIRWASTHADHFNVKLVPSIVPFQGQIELAGTDRKFVQTKVTGNRSYRFSIQGCDRDFWGKSKCSEWVVKDIWVPIEKGFHSWRRWFMIHPEAVSFTNPAVNIQVELHDFQQNDTNLSHLKQFLKEEVLQGLEHKVKEDIDLALFKSVTPVTAVSRSQDHLDIFKVGFNGAVWSSWWHDDAERWQPWFQIYPQTVFDQKAPVTAVARHKDHMDLFITGSDGAIWSSWWHNDDVGWRPWFQIHPQTVFRQDRSVAAVALSADHMDIFRVGFDGAVWSSWWHNDPVGWRPWFQIHPQTRFPKDAHITALARRPDHLDIFVVGHDGAVWSSWWHDDGKSWRPWYQIHPATVFRHDQEIVPVSREPEHVDLFTIGHDGAVWSSWWHNDKDSWRPWFRIHPETVFDPTSRITAISRSSDHIDLFVTGKDGSVWSSWWHADAKGWRPWFQIYPETVFDPGHPVTAVARHSKHMDIFKVGLNGAVWSAWWSPD